MTDESASDGGGCLRCPKRTGQAPVRSLPRKENGKARTSMDEKSVRKSHGQHIPPAKGMDERALLLLGLLSLLTAADEVRHADAQHRATSDPSEGHAVKTGQREAGALLVDNSEAELTGRRGSRIVLHDTTRCIDCRIRTRDNVTAILVKIALDGKGHTVCCGVVVTRGGRNLREDVGALVETDNINLAGVISCRLISDLSRTL